MAKGARLYFTLVVIVETTGVCTRSLNGTEADALANQWTRPPAIRMKLNGENSCVDTEQPVQRGGCFLLEESGLSQSEQIF